MLNDIICYLNRPDNLIARYQTGVAAIIALTIAFQQMRIAKRQARISQEQHKLKLQQSATDRALAQLKVDRAILACRRMSNAVMEIPRRQNPLGPNPEYFWQFDWGVLLLNGFELIDEVGLEAASSVAYPEHAVNILRAAQAYNTIAKYKKEFDEVPFELYLFDREENQHLQSDADRTKEMNVSEALDYTLRNTLRNVALH